ncbi:hypothetical protein EYF80_044961 [Liparis tanakae]|uniref:Uncharacterized protein n=1 Tax=Liparis tanakae TaxID=230148 RepID=A0A4Z2FVK9_9TELE|nr:hypothetical protein EYF80_044961 [Liparis tanakae]
MDFKKKTFLDNFNLKATLANLKKPGKKNLRRGRKLAHRRSISVPDLRCTDSHLVSPPYDSRSYGIAAGLSDTDSVASGSIADGSLYAYKLNDSVSESRLKVPKTRVEAALNRMSAPVGSIVYEEIDDNLCSPVESADGNSLDSACGSTTEEQVNMPWLTDSEELDQELCSPFFMRDFTVEEALLERAQSEEALEETTEMSSEPWDFFDENQDLLENPVLSAGPDVQTPDPCQRYLLSINLKKGRNLVIRDKRSGRSRNLQAALKSWSLTVRLRS